MTTSRSVENMDFEHPMDGFPVRPLAFGANTLDTDSVLWSQSSPEFAMSANAVNVHVPYFERYLIRAMSEAKKHIKDEKLLADISGLIGQEGHHAKNFIDFNKVMTRRYPGIEALEKHAKEYFAERSKKDSLKQLVGFTAGYETFTMVAGIIILANYEKWMGDSDPTVKAMWVWHQVEEIEHGAVAFEVYKSLYGEHEWYRKYMILTALLQIGRDTAAAYLLMCRAEGYMKRLPSAFRAVWFLVSIFTRSVWHCLPAFSKNYHPRNHPVATTRQNKIAVGWRRFTKAGGDPLKIDRAKMQEIIGFS